MPPDLIELEVFDMLELIDYRDQRRSDNPSSKPGRKNAGGKNENCQADEQMPYRCFNRTKKLRFRNDGRERPTGKGKRRQIDSIGISAGDQSYLVRNLFIAVVGAAGLFDRAMGDWQQRLIPPLHTDFISILIGGGDGGPISTQDESCAGFSDGELRQKLREPRVFDDNCKHTLPFLVHVDLTGIA